MSCPTCFSQPAIHLARQLICICVEFPALFSVFRFGTPQNAWKFSRNIHNPAVIKSQIETACYLRFTLMTISFANLSASSARWSQSGDLEEYFHLSIDIQVHTVQITISSFSASNHTLEGFSRVREIWVARVLRQFQRSLDVTCPFSMLRVQVVDQGNSNAVNRVSFKTRGGGAAYQLRRIWYFTVSSTQDRLDLSKSASEICPSTGISKDGSSCAIRTGDLEVLAYELLSSCIPWPTASLRGVIAADQCGPLCQALSTT